MQALTIKELGQMYFPNSTSKSAGARLYDGSNLTNNFGLNLPMLVIAAGNA